MKTTITRFICRILAASLIVLPWQAQAGMIGTDQALGAAQNKVANFLQRGEVAAQLERLGVSPRAAQERVAALTDAQVAEIAGRIDALPAGSGLLVVIVVVWLAVYFLSYSPGALLKDDPAPAAKPGAKPAAKPAPEKK